MEKETHRIPKDRNREILIYCILATAVITWQSTTYSGIVRPIGEWQFTHIGRFFPVATLFSLLVIAMLPILVWQRWRSRREQYRDAGLTMACTLSRRTGFTYAVVASCLATVAIVTLVLAAIAFLPGAAPRALAAGNQPPADSGQVRMSGYVDKSRILEIHEDAILTERTSYVAPILAYPGDRSEIRYFVPVIAQLGTPAGQPATMVPVTQGYLKLHGMPEEAANLLRARGHAVARRPALLYRTAAEAAWTGLAFGLLSGLVALVFAAGALIESRRTRRLIAVPGSDAALA